MNDCMARQRNVERRMRAISHAWRHLVALTVRPRRQSRRFDVAADLFGSRINLQGPPDAISDVCQVAQRRRLPALLGLGGQIG